MAFGGINGGWCGRHWLSQEAVIGPMSPPGWSLVAASCIAFGVIHVESHRGGSSPGSLNHLCPPCSAITIAKGKRNGPGTDLCPKHEPTKP